MGQEQRDLFPYRGKDCGELKINISALTIEAKEGLFEGNIRLYVHDKEELDSLVQSLVSMPGIESVERYDMEDIPS